MSLSCCLLLSPLFSDARINHYCSQPSQPSPPSSRIMRSSTASTPIYSIALHASAPSFPPLALPTHLHPRYCNMPLQPRHLPAPESASLPPSALSLTPPPFVPKTPQKNPKERKTHIPPQAPPLPPQLSQPLLHLHLSYLFPFLRLHFQTIDVGVEHPQRFV